MTVRVVPPRRKRIARTAAVHAERKTWLAENRDDIDAYNRRVEVHGVFSDAWRSFG